MKRQRRFKYKKKKSFSCSSLTLTLREFPCKLFHTTGNCVNGDECMFSHESLNDDTQELLNKVGVLRRSLLGELL